MGQRRMFNKQITESDAFTEMPASAQMLYFHIGMQADDDGFVNSPRGVQRTVGASPDDLRILVAKKFLILFEDGVVAIKHWCVNNQLRKDRHVPTRYQDDLMRLRLDGEGVYHLAGQMPLPAAETTCQPDDNHVATACRPDGGEWLPQSELNRNLIGTQAEAGKGAGGTAPRPKRERFSPPTAEDVAAYARDTGRTVDAERFVDFYASKGWRVGKSPMRDWRAAVRNWASRDGPRGPRTDARAFAEYD